MKQHGMLKDGIDEELLGFLILQFSNSVIGNMDVSVITRPFIDEIDRLKRVYR